ncbi:MAG: hypothetical protein AB1670_01075 [Pseudomonadota bacterium]|jgi:hypothetical protein|uniref:Uncharacterized protein n=3 Tax=Ralstonia TaxID=48736 RepID=R0E8Y5_RALPI|nr:MULTISPECIES: hypothetical protein [Ralstonia]ENZ77862.1 hypothetical protein OR214_02138 [Ralstonia pickettii OR214]MBL4777819.1 hypothetical protein [Ralstonia sp.]MCM3582041.1 hypothetical protein [Ralstonia pickettii]MDR9384627.1 hypothetical protein [Ralstonia sp. 11b]OCS50562.1 hypothetical protein BEK68_13860 [Ralstonia pickettii]
MASLSAFSQAGARTSKWAIELLDANGAFQGAATEIWAHYKAPIALLAAGHRAQADQVLGHLCRHFLRNGDFHYGAGDPTPAPGSNYRNGWIAWGAHQLGAYDVSGPVLDFLESQIHPERGGVLDFDTASTMHRMLDIGTTASVVNALLIAGRIEAATKAARMFHRVFGPAAGADGRVLLRESWDGQMLEPERLSTVLKFMTMRDGCRVPQEWAALARGRSVLSRIRQASKGQGGQLNGLLAIELNRGGQIYWFLGFSMRVLAQLFRATGDQAWLTLGHRVGGLVGRCQPDIYNSATSAKVAWGAAEMYAVSGDRRYFDLSMRIADWLISTQEPGGIWLRRPQYERIEAQPLSVSLDTSLERVVYMYEIPRALGLSE